MHRSVMTILLVFLLVGFFTVLGHALNRPAQRVNMSPTNLGHRININTADAPTLTLLRGIGPRLADAVIDHRNTHGPFDTVDSLDNVKGIGPRTLATIRDYLKTQ